MFLAGPLATPRAAGIRTATAPLVFIGETHGFLRHDAAEKLLAAAAARPVGGGHSGL